jgi:hypothetical protein
VAYTQQYRWSAFGGAVIAACAALLCAELTLRWIYPANVLREVADGVADLERRTPHILVISSSHGRSFHVLGQEIEARTGGAVTLTSVPLEGGHASAMRWVLQERVRALIDEPDAKPARSRAPLQEIVFGVTWWDTCRREIPGDVEQNVASKAWRWRDMWQHVAAHGVNDAERNFLNAEMQRRIPLPDLIHRRGQLLDATRAALAQVGLTTPPSRERAPPEEAAFLASWRHDIETGAECILAPMERAALEDVVSFAHERGLGITVVLFPLKPATVTQLGREQTLRPFAERMRSEARRLGFRLIDFTELPVLTDADFMLDFDHLTVSGNRKFTTYALQHDLAFLAAPADRHAIATHVSNDR